MEMRELDRVEGLLGEVRSGANQLGGSIASLVEAVQIVGRHVETSDEVAKLLGEFSRHVRAEVMRLGRLSNVSEEVAELVGRYGDRGEEMAEFVGGRAVAARKDAERLLGVCARIDSAAASEPELGRHVEGSRRVVERVAVALRSFDLDRKIRRRIPENRRSAERSRTSEHQAEQEVRQIEHDVSDLIQAIKNL